MVVSASPPVGDTAQHVGGPDGERFTGATPMVRIGDPLDHAPYRKPEQPESYEAEDHLSEGLIEKSRKSAAASAGLPT